MIHNNPLGLFNYFTDNINSNTIKQPKNANQYLKSILGEGFNEYVYVIYNDNTGLYKIGITENFKVRLMSLTSQSGCKIYPIFLLELSIFEQPSAKSHKIILHDFFKNKRVIGEWFNLTKRDLVCIRSLFYDISANDFNILY